MPGHPQIERGVFRRVHGISKLYLREIAAPFEYERERPVLGIISPAAGGHLWHLPDHRCVITYGHSHRLVPDYQSDVSAWRVPFCVVLDRVLPRRSNVGIQIELDWSLLPRASCCARMAGDH